MEDESKIQETILRMARERKELKQTVWKIMRRRRLSQSRKQWDKLHGEFLLEKWERQKGEIQDRVRESKSEISWLGDRVRSTQEELAEAQGNIQLIEELKAYLSRLGNLIRKKQEELAEAQRDLRRIEEAKPRKDSGNKADFERLLSFPSVLAIEVIDGEVRVWTQPVIFENEGEKYDLGNFLVKVIDLDTCCPEIEVICVVSGRLDGEERHLYGGGYDGDFCFGDRGDHIHDLLEKKETLAALDLALQGVFYVNPSNRPELPDFLEVTNEKSRSRKRAA